MKPLHAILLSLLLTLIAACTLPAERAVGDWHGTMTTPQGNLSIAVRISYKDGALAGDMESIDQAPGELIPITITKADDKTLEFTVPSVAARYAGIWDERAGGWAGTWMQSNYKFPLVLRSGPSAVSVKGMDGRWEATVTRDGAKRRLVLRIITSGDNTIIKFDAPDAGANNLGVADFSRKGDKIHFEVPITGAKFDGVLSADAVAAAAIAGITAGQFFIFPHPAVPDYWAKKAARHDKWLLAMEQLQLRFAAAG